jgi:hypothetical protein
VDHSQCDTEPVWDTEEQAYVCVHEFLDEFLGGAGQGEVRHVLRCPYGRLATTYGRPPTGERRVECGGLTHPHSGPWPDCLTEGARLDLRNILAQGFSRDDVLRLLDGIAVEEVHES